MNDLISIQVINGVACVSSVEVAERFGKRHDNVMRDIRKLQADLAGESDALKFEAVDYRDAKGEMRPSYLMDERSFTVLVSGFDGVEAIKWKIKFYDAFAAMRERLQSPKQELTLVQMCEMQLSLARQQEADRMRLKAVESRLGINTRVVSNALQSVVAPVLDEMSEKIAELQARRPPLPAEVDIPEGWLCSWDYLGETDPERRNKGAANGIGREAAKLARGFAYGAGPKADWPRTAYPRNIMEEAHRRHSYNIRYGKTET